MYHKNSLLYEEEYYKIVGLCMKVHKKLTKTHKEVVYQDALEIEFIQNNIPYEREKQLSLYYEGKKLKHQFRVDFLLYGCIILEIKATSKVNSSDFKQTLNYVKASEIELAILVNFGSDRLTHQRVISSNI